MGKSCVIHPRIGYTPLCYQEPDMLAQWINELMNLLAGNSRYVNYPWVSQLIFILILLFFLLIPVLLVWVG